jgi:hypothetical protein
MSRSTGGAFEILTREVEGDGQSPKKAKETAPLRVELRTFRFVFLLDQMNDQYNSRLR